MINKSKQRWAHIFYHVSGKTVEAEAVCGNYTMVQLRPDRAMIKAEGVAMRHCLEQDYESYCQRMERGEIELYSIVVTATRQPVVDVELALTRSSYGGPVASRCITQVRGVSNQCPPAKQYVAATMLLLLELEAAISGHGIISFDGKIDGDELRKAFDKLDKDEILEVRYPKWAEKRRKMAANIIATVLTDYQKSLCRS